jgi:hypothetical protein
MIEPSLLLLRLLDVEDDLEEEELLELELEELLLLEEWRGSFTFSQPIFAASLISIP